MPRLRPLARRIALTLSRHSPYSDRTQCLLDGLLGSSAPISLRLRVQALLSAGDIRGAVEFVLTSTDFAQDRLPSLVGRTAQGWCGRSIFFLHIPKTSGVSTRLALAEASGVPPIYALGLPGDLPARKWDSVAFWPFFAAHRHVDFFPQSHVGVTTFRDPRSRLLSLYRQFQRQDPETFRLLSPEQQAKRKQRVESARSLDLAQWLGKGDFYPMTWYFTAGHRDDPSQFTSVASRNELRESLARGLDRIGHAAWSHRSGEVEDMIHEATGHRVSLGRHNIGTSSHAGPPDAITQTALDRLDEIYRLDQVLIDMAQSAGLLNRISRSEEESLFEATAHRLGFSIR